ncbi:hypothetical protein IPA_05070 [Ignicoccus pacificus DSM 13166]|uniref:Deoxyribose-phosphate aldolase n=1 Tax=Ignicoccus pacificus DSM 13166 TaxID=940294 RepID=A0A977KCN3_9CREN|nr:hypothetical protein IPA_05070 [Ignicoccus pacificus DSM 13166]
MLDLISLIRSYTPEELASRIDQTLLISSPDKAIEFAKLSSKYPFRSLVGFPQMLSYFKKYWKGRLTAVTNFPYGLSPLDAVEKEMREAWEQGAVEVDVVASPYLFKKDIDEYREYIRGMVGLAREIGFDVVKVIVEAPLLSDEELIRVAKIIEEVKADFLKTSTGVLAKTKMRDIYLVKMAAPSLEVKASGGIREPVQAISMIALGTSVIGTSTGIEIVEEMKLLKRLI